jgi:hypothetical protein
MIQQHWPAVLQPWLEQHLTEAGQQLFQPTAAKAPAITFKALTVGAVPPQLLAIQAAPRGSNVILYYPGGPASAELALEIRLRDRVLPLTITNLSFQLAFHLDVEFPKANLSVSYGALSILQVIAFDFDLTVCGLKDSSLLFIKDYIRCHLLAALDALLGYPRKLEHGTPPEEYQTTVQELTIPTDQTPPVADLLGQLPQFEEALQLLIRNAAQAIDSSLAPALDHAEDTSATAGQSLKKRDRLLQIFSSTKRLAVPTDN